MTKPADLPIPLYLDTTTMLDLLATLEGGYSTADRISTETIASGDQSASGGIAFGFGALMSFFRLQGHTHTGSSERSESERVFTLGSLLARLRSSLVENELMTVLGDMGAWSRVAVSDIVEVQGTFAPNPLISSVSRVRRVFEYAEELQLASEAAQKVQNKTPSMTNKTALKPLRESVSERRNDTVLSSASTLLNSLMPELKESDSLLYVVQSTSVQSCKAVVSLFPSLLRAKSGIELPEGELRLLGKVSRVLHEHEEIDLLRGTPLEGLNENLVNQFIDTFQQVGSHIRLPNIVTSVKAPAIMVIPVAVYL